MKKKALSLMLCALALGTMTACSSTETAETTAKEAAEEAAETTEAAEAEAEDAETAGASAEETGAAAAAEYPVTVIDQNGMEVVIESRPERLVTTALPLPSIYALTGAPIEYLVGVHPGSTSAIENSVMAAMYPELSGIADGFIEGTDINVEELLKR